MERIADDVFRIALIPRDAINAYLLGDVIVDAGVPGTVKRIVKEVAGHEIRTHAITHAHQDHAGGSSRLIDAFGLDGVAAGEADADAVEHGEPVLTKRANNVLGRFYANFDGVPVTRRLREGDEIGPGFVVVDCPGHSPGHVAFWRERDRILIAGDVFFNMDVVTTRPGLHEPLKLFTPDPARNRESMRKLAALEPAVTGFGHGPLLRDPAALAAFAAARG